LSRNTIGNFNTAVGLGALENSTAADNNTAVGINTLLVNDVGHDNTACGANALQQNAGHSSNTAVGFDALLNSSTGDGNTAIGWSALLNNTSGSSNVAAGAEALKFNTTGSFNIAIGESALTANTSGDNNVSIGPFSGGNSPGGGNVYIGFLTGGVEGEDNHTYIRNINRTSVNGGNADTVTIDLLSGGLLGHASSSRRYKEEIKPMDKASEVLFALKPVSYRFKKDVDKSQSLDYGFIAEDVAKVDPNLAITDGSGQIENVRYNAINAMLLNEFIKEHGKVKQLEAAFTTLNTRLDEQAAQIQKLSAQP
jgi:Chaperone of endosialidase